MATETIVLKKPSSRLIKISILSVALMQMSVLGISPAVAGILRYFPEVTSSQAQMIMILPAPMVIVSSLITARLALFFESRKLVFIGVLFITLTGVLGFLFHDSLNILYLWSVFIGVGIGMFSALLSSIVASNFSGDERGRFTGMQTAVITFGGILLTMVGGVLCNIQWYYNYLVYLFGLIGLFFIIIGFPGNIPIGKIEKVKGHVSTRSISLLFWSFSMVILYHNIPTNISLYIEEKLLGDAAIVGTVTSVLFLGGVISGLSYGRLREKLHNYMIPLSFVIMSIGLLGLVFSTKLWQVYPSIFISGLSVNFIMSHIIFRIGEDEKKIHVPVAMSLMVVTGNLGQFASISISRLSDLFIPELGIGGRYLVCAILSITLACFSAYTFRKT